jgi:hypothetical protein
VITFGFQPRSTGAEDLAVLESLPFDALWVGGHIASRTGAPEVMMQLARLAALTVRIHPAAGPGR